MPRKRKPTAPTGVLTVSPNPIPLGTSSVVISGTGFAPNKTVYIDAADLVPDAVVTDGNGSFSMTYIHDWRVGGDGVIRAYDNGTASGTPLASVMFTVV